MLGGADVLRGARGGHSKVRPPSGFGPHHGGGKAPKAPLTHPRVQTVLRNAVFFIFDHCDLGVVPAQFWPFLTATGDPGEAVTAFLRAIGCDPDAIRRGDRREREKAAEIIDFLVMSGDVLDRLSPEVRNVLGQRLEAGDYAVVRDVARVAAELRAALDVEARWRGAKVLPSLQSLLATIRNLAEHPLDATPDDAEHAARLARDYSAAQTDFDESCHRYDGIVSELKNVWPSTGWSGGDEEAALRHACTGFETARDGLRTYADLNIDQVQLALRTLSGHIDELEQLLDRARATAMGLGGPQEREAGRRLRKTFRKRPDA
jgi:hypothetical protein